MPMYRIGNKNKEENLEKNPFKGLKTPEPETPESSESSETPEMPPTPPPCQCESCMNRKVEEENCDCHACNPRRFCNCEFCLKSGPGHGPYCSCSECRDLLRQKNRQGSQGKLNKISQEKPITQPVLNKTETENKKLLNVNNYIKTFMTNII